MITSTSYLQRISKIYNPSYFQIDYARTIAKWCVDHFKVHGGAPEESIRDIFKTNHREFREGQAELAEAFLVQLDNLHQARESFNVEYLFRKTRMYFHKRALLSLTERVEALTLDGKLGEAESTIKGFKAVAQDVSPWINPFDDKFITQVFDSREANQLLRLPGKLGDMLGPLERGWLIGWLGPMKRGKTFWLFECAIRAAMQKLNVVIASLEMNAVTNAMRIYRRVTALPDPEHAPQKDRPRMIIYPVFDCGNNQDGTCRIPQRLKINDIPLFSEDRQGFPRFSPEMEYRPCDFCRNNRDVRLLGNYLTSTWYKQSPIEKAFGIEAVRKAKKRFAGQFGQRIRFQSYPAYSASTADLEADLDTLEMTEGFIADVIVIDYADILMPGDKRLIDRSALDSIWKGLKGLAEKRNCLVITASQSNRKSIDNPTIRQTDAAEDIRKLAHVDAMFGLNQTPQEKLRMIMRINILANRHRPFSERQIIVLNQLELGLPYLDSDLVHAPQEKEEEE